VLISGFVTRGTGSKKSCCARSGPNPRPPSSPLTDGASRNPEAHPLWLGPRANCGHRHEQSGLGRFPRRFTARLSSRSARFRCRRPSADGGASLRPLDSGAYSAMGDGPRAGKSGVALVEGVPDAGPPGTAERGGREHLDAWRARRRPKPRHVLISPALRITGTTSDTGADPRHRPEAGHVVRDGVAALGNSHVAVFDSQGGNPNRPPTNRVGGSGSRPRRRGGRMTTRTTTRKTDMDARERSRRAPWHLPRAASQDFGGCFLTPGTPGVYTAHVTGRETARAAFGLSSKSTKLRLSLVSDGNLLTSATGSTPVAFFFLSSRPGGLRKHSNSFEREEVWPHTCRVADTGFRLSRPWRLQTYRKSHRAIPASHVSSALARI